MCDVTVKVLSALSGLVFPHGWESARLADGTLTRVHGRDPRSCACTRMQACLGRGRGSIPRAGPSARRRSAMRPSVPHGRHLGNALTLKQRATITTTTIIVTNTVNQRCIDTRTRATDFSVQPGANYSRNHLSRKN